MINTVINGKIPGPNGRPIVYDFFYELNRSKAPIVIFCHGYKGYKDWGAWTLFAKDFASQGIAFLKFNFCVVKFTFKTRKPTSDHAEGCGREDDRATYGTG